MGVWVVNRGIPAHAALREFSAILGYSVNVQWCGIPPTVESI